jgi:hypothetical protein
VALNSARINDHKKLTGNNHSIDYYHGTRSFLVTVIEFLQISILETESRVSKAFAKGHLSCPSVSAFVKVRLDPKDSGRSR